MNGMLETRYHSGQNKRFAMMMSISFSPIIMKVDYVFNDLFEVV